MFVLRDEAVSTNSRVTNPSSTIWLFLTFEFLVGALLSGLLAILGVIRSLLPKPPRDLAGDVVLVAGASSSIGESLADEFAKNGCSVICVDNDPRSVEELASSLRMRYPAIEQVTSRHRKDLSPNLRPTISSYACDLLNQEEIRRTARKVKDEVGRVDVLVTCIANTSQDIFDTTSRTLMSHFWAVLAFLPLMLYDKRAHVVAVTPVASSRDAYHGSRVAVVGLMETLCRELSNHSSYLTFLAFTPTAECSTTRESEQRAARDIVRAVKTDQHNLSWTSRFFYRISCLVYHGITSLTQWIHLQGCDYSA